MTHVVGEQYAELAIIDMCTEWRHLDYVWLSIHLLRCIMSGVA